jgi:hypothetical protein
MSSTITNKEFEKWIENNGLDLVEYYKQQLITHPDLKFETFITEIYWLCTSNNKSQLLTPNFPNRTKFCFTTEEMDLFNLAEENKSNLQNKLNLQNKPDSPDRNFLIWREGENNPNYRTFNLSKTINTIYKKEINKKETTQFTIWYRHYCYHLKNMYRLYITPSVVNISYEKFVEIAYVCTDRYFNRYTQQYDPVLT